MVVFKNIVNECEVLYKNMSEISGKRLRKINKSVKNGIRTIFVEGPADRCIYKRFYPESNFIFARGCEDIIRAMKLWNSTFGKTPLVVAIIDRDFRTEEEMEQLFMENIFTLRIREIESIFLREDVIKGLFGDEIFESFAQKIKLNAIDRTPEEITNYDEALNVLKKKVSSKYAIRLLMQEVGRRNKGNEKNIEYLCCEMDRTSSWNLVEDIIPRIERIGHGENCRNSGLY